MKVQTVSFPFVVVDGPDGVTERVFEVAPVLFH